MSFRHWGLHFYHKTEIRAPDKLRSGIEDKQEILDVTEDFERKMHPKNYSWDISVPLQYLFGCRSLAYKSLFSRGFGSGPTSVYPTQQNKSSIGTWTPVLRQEFNQPAALWLSLSGKVTAPIPCSLLIVFTIHVDLLRKYNSCFNQYHWLLLTIMCTLQNL